MLKLPWWIQIMQPEEYELDEDHISNADMYDSISNNNTPIMAAFIIIAMVVIVLS